MLTESSQGDDRRYNCAACDYSTSKLSNWTKHIGTQKHIQLHSSSPPTRSHGESGPLQCKCGRTYKHMSSLSRHRRTCRALGHSGLGGSAETGSREIAELRAKAALYDQQCKSVQELKDLVEKVASRPTTTTTTNNLNINVILEQKCSGAPNLTDFVDSLRLTLEDLSYTQRYGFVKGISNVFIQALQGLQPAVRPIHCIDNQGKRLYIRDANKWGEDADGKILNSQIGAVTKKQISELEAWQKANNSWRESEEGTLAYMQLVQEITGEATEKEQKKNTMLIQQEIGKVCTIGDLAIVK